MPKQIKDSAIVVALIGAMSAGGAWIYHLIDSNAKAQAEIKVREKYDDILTKYAVLSATCQSK